jgi:hypothetical protein
VAEPEGEPVNAPPAPAVPGYEDALSLLVAAAAPSCGSLAELLTRVPGAYPADVLAIVENLTTDRLLDPGTRQRLLSRPAPDDPARMPGIPLPDPHPLDFDWRWDSETVRDLIAQCVGLTRPGQTIVLLGAPTLLAEACRDDRDRRWVLLEANDATVAAIPSAVPACRAVRCDLASDDLPQVTGHVVIADPPWYPEDTRVFLWAAATLACPGAPVLLAQPPLATRPGILPERARILAFAKTAGLDVTRIRPAALRYHSPPFERAALRASGLLGVVPATWRHGDVIELRRTETAPPERRSGMARETWREVILDGARIRFRLDQHDSGNATADPRLIQLIDADILPSVSRRDPRRSQVRVWTASNRVFGCRTPVLLAALAAALADSDIADSVTAAHLGRPPTEPEEHAAAAAIRQLRDLTRAEQQTAREAVAAALPSAAIRTCRLAARNVT